MGGALSPGGRFPAGSAAYRGGARNGLLTRGRHKPPHLARAAADTLRTWAPSRAWAADRAVGPKMVHCGGGLPPRQGGGYSYSPAMGAAPPTRRQRRSRPANGWRVAAWGELHPRVTSRVCVEWKSSEAWARCGGPLQCLRFDTHKTSTHWPPSKALGPTIDLFKGPHGRPDQIVSGLCAPNTAPAAVFASNASWPGGGTGVSVDQRGRAVGPSRGLGVTRP